MKRALLYLTLLSVTTAYAQNPNVITIQATLPGLSSGTWVYWYPLTNSLLKDSAQTTKNGFSITVPIQDPDAYVIQLGAPAKNNAITILYLDKGAVTINSPGPDFKNAVTTGGRAITDYNAYQKYKKDNPKLAGQEQLYTKANELYKAHDSAGYAALRPQIEHVDSIDKELTKQWILSHPASPVSAFILTFQLGRLDLEKRAALFAKLTPEAKQNAPAKRLEHSIAVDKLTGIGRTALDFTQNDTAGRPVSLEDFRGKYLLVDFWASWCVPCRAENPNVVAAFNKYKDRNFTVLSVSLDRPGAAEAWLNAIHKDGLTWTHVSDLKFWNNAVARQYDIEEIPSNLLLDPNGVILAKNLHGEELAATLEKVLKAFTLNGKIEAPSAKTTTKLIHLYYTDTTGKTQKDSARVTNGTFTFHGYIDGPTMAYLAGDTRSGSAGDPNATSFFMEPGIMTISLKQDHFKDAVTTGSKTQTEYRALEEQKKPILLEEKPLEKAYKEANDAYTKAVQDKADESTRDTLKYRAAALHDQFEPYGMRMAQLDYAFFAAHPQSYVTAFMLRFHTSSLSLDSLSMFYDRLGPALQHTSMGRELSKEIAQLKAGSPGSMAADFTTKDINGNSLTLSSFRGKYILLDFWASWCVPCRKSMPHVKELYAKYKDKGFDVIAVSDDDRNHDAWERAIEKDGTGLWHNVLRGMDMQKIMAHEPNDNDISEKFGIHTLPTKIVIDPQGRIIGRYTSGTDEEAAALDRQLAEALGK